MRVGDDLGERGAVARRQRALAGRPRQRDPNRAQPEVLSGRDHWGRVPLERVVGNTDEHPRFGLRNWRRNQQPTQREDDHE